MIFVFDYEKKGNLLIFFTATADFPLLFETVLTLKSGLENTEFLKPFF